MDRVIDGQSGRQTLRGAILVGAAYNYTVSAAVRPKMYYTVHLDVLSVNAESRSVEKYLPTAIMSVGVGRIFESVCLFVCLFVPSITRKRMI